jgi:hypothetical protein
MPLNIKHTQFLNVIDIISQFGLNIMHNHLNAALNPICTRSFTTTYGLPSAHALKPLIERQIDFDVSLVHKPQKVPPSSN